jgi:hypothetical protein
MPIGTTINAIAVLIGGLVGLLIKKQFPKRVEEIIFNAMGLITIALAIQMTLKMNDFLVIAFSIIIGAFIGELVKIESRLEQFGDLIKTKLHAKDARFTEGLVTAFLLYCIGPMTILGTINEGLRGDRSLILTKSMLDGITSIIFAATFGISIAFSALPLFLYQTLLTLLASSLQGLFTPIMINQFTAVGGILLLGIGINLLNIKHIKVANLLPSLIVVLILTAIFK